MINGGIIFLSPYDPRDPRRWSGTIFSIYEELARSNPGRIRIVDVGWLTFCARVANRLLQVVGRRQIDIRFSTIFAFIAGVYVSLRLTLLREKAVIAVAASNYLPYVRTRKTIIYISDATFRAISNLYPEFKCFPEWLKRQGNNNEEVSLGKARYVIYPSKWASDSAQNDYGVGREKIVQIPFGPNIPSEMIERFYATKGLPTAINILFVSADWKRKNGDHAIQICRDLRGCGVDARLVTIGKTPSYVREIDFVDDRGVIDKFDAQHLVDLCAAYRDAQFLLVPSSADAFGIVFSEAQAFGVPPIGYDVGGVSSAIENRQTGLLFPLNTPPIAIAAEMARYIKDPELYQQLSNRCRDWHLRQANWSNWSKVIYKLSENI